jgi:hypothetical protein
MISTCANPQCGTAFHYLRGGSLYRFDLRRPKEPCADVPNAICASKPTHASVYFWLCGDCSRKNTIRFSSQEGVSVIPLGHIAQRRNPVVAHVADAE